MAAYTAADLQEILVSTHEYIDNPKNPHVVDRKAMPWWSFLSSIHKEAGTARGSVTVKYKRDGGLKLQFFEGKQLLKFGEKNIGWDLTFPYAQMHLGEEFPHQKFEDAGYSIMPNGPRTPNSLFKKNSKDDTNRLIELAEEYVEELHDNFDREMDETMLLDGSADPLAPVGLDGLLPLDPTSGTLGGKSRTDPIIQHSVITGITTGVGGNLDQAFNQLIRRANLNNRGMRSNVDMIMTGSEGLDRYISFAKANNFEYKSGIEGIKKMDVGVMDSAIYFQGIPIVYNPTMDSLAISTGVADWTRRFYFLASKTWRFFNAPGKWKHVSAPLDPYNQLVSRVSIHQRSVLVPLKPNGNAIGVLN